MATANGTATTPRLTPEDERRFLLVGIEDERAKLKARMDYLDAQIAVINGRGMTGTPQTRQVMDTTKASSKSKGRRRHISEGAREKMRAAQQARWARVRAEKAGQAPPPSPLAESGEAAQV